MTSSTPIISIMEWNGNSVQTDKTSSIIRFKGADDAAVNSTNPLTIPGSGRTFSYEKWLRLRIGVGDAAQQLSNVKFYTDGSSGFGAGVSLYGEVSATDTFRSACNPSTNNNPPNGGSGSRTMTNIFIYTAASALSLTSASQTFSGTSTDVGRFVVLVMGVVPGATAGTLTAETLSFSYDTSAMATTAQRALSTSLDAKIAQTFTVAASFDGVTGEASADLATGIVNVEGSIFLEDLLINDFTELPDDQKAVTSLLNVVNGSASLGDSVVLFTPSACGTCSFNYIGTYAGSTDTGSVTVTANPFPDAAFLGPFYGMVHIDPVVEQRTGHARSTGFDILKQVVSFDSGQERFTADLSSGAALGMLVEDTGGNMLANAALSGAGTTNPTGWLSIFDGTRSGTASTLGLVDGAQAYVQTAFAVDQGGPGGRPYLAQTLTTVSTSQTFIASMFVEYYTGQATAQILGLAGFGSVTGTLFLSASQLTQGNFPQRVSMPFMNIQSATDKTTGTVRYGLGNNSSTSGTMIISRPMLEKKGGLSSFTPDALRNPDMPIVRVDGSFPYCTASGTFVIQARPPDLPSGVGTQMLMQLDDGTTSNMQQIFRNSSGDIVYKIVTSGVQQFRAAYPGPTANQTFRLQADYSSGSCAFSLNGLTACATVTTTMPLGLATMRIGANELGTNQWNGAIAELNVYRKQQGGMILPTTGPTDPGGGSGGDGGGGGSLQPLSYYGVGHQMISLANTTMNVAGRQIIFRVAARKTGTISHVKWYAITADCHPTPCTPYGKYNGVAGQYGGLIRTSIWSNNPLPGSGGTGANVPSVQLGVCADWTAHDHDTIVYPEQSCAIAVTEGQIIHIMFKNIDPNPGSNYISTDCIRPAGDSSRVPHNPSIPDLYDSVYYRNSSINTWTLRPQTPIYQLRYSDGTYQGVPYVESALCGNATASDSATNCVNSSGRDVGDEGRFPLGGNNMLRQIFMPHENCTVTQFNIVARLGGSPSNLLIETRQQSGNVLKDSTNKTRASVNPTALSGDDWVGPVNLSSGPIVLSSSRTYVTTLSAVTGTWNIAGIRDGTLNLQQTFNPTIGVTGRAEKSENGGTSWTGFKLNGVHDVDQVDLMFYYTRTA